MKVAQVSYFENKRVNQVVQFSRSLTLSTKKYNTFFKLISLLLFISLLNGILQSRSAFAHMSITTKRKHHIIVHQSMKLEYERTLSSDKYAAAFGNQNLKLQAAKPEKQRFWGLEVQLLRQGSDDYGSKIDCEPDLKRQY